MKRSIKKILIISLFLLTFLLVREHLILAVQCGVDECKNKGEGWYECNGGTMCCKGYGCPSYCLTIGPSREPTIPEANCSPPASQCVNCLGISSGGGGGGGGGGGNNSPTPTSSNINADVDGDKLVTFKDYFYFLRKTINASVPSGFRFDFNNDGAVDVKDREIIVNILKNIW